MSSVSDAVEATVAALPLKPQDEAAVALAVRYAAAIDDGDGDLARLGPPLLAALTALGATPAARAAIVRGGAPDERPTASPLDELLARRAARA